MRNSKQKTLIYDIISNNRKHFTAEQVYFEARQFMPKISLGTVYRNLNSLVSENKVRRIKMSDGTDRFDHTNDYHDHFICTNCNSIIDIESKNKVIPKNINGNKVMSYEVVYKGLCKNCLKKER